MPPLDMTCSRMHAFRRSGHKDTFENHNRFSDENVFSKMRRLFPRVVFCLLTNPLLLRLSSRVGRSPLIDYNVRGGFTPAEKIHSIRDTPVWLGAPLLIHEKVLNHEKISKLLLTRPPPSRTFAKFLHFWNCQDQDQEKKQYRFTTKSSIDIIDCLFHKPTKGSSTLTNYTNIIHPSLHS